MLFLAQAQPDDFGPWLSNAFYILGFVTACVVLYQRLRPLPPRQTTIEGQPVVVRADTEFAPKAEVEALKTRVDRMDAGFKTSMDGLRREVKEDFKDMRELINSEIGMVHTRTNDVLAAVSELKGQLRNTQGKQP